MSKTLIAKTPKLPCSCESCEDRFYCTPGHGALGFGFCKELTDKIFNLPKSTAAVQFFAYNQPTRDRYRVDFSDNYLVFEGHGPEWIISEQYRNVLRLLGKERIVYVECYYWE